MLTGIVDAGQKGVLALRSLAARLTAEKAMKLDLIGDTSLMEMVVHEDKVLSLGIRELGTYPLRPLAHEQIAGRLKIPKPYYDRMLKEDPHLLATNVDAWFWKYPEKRLVRTLGGDARAFLSNSYQRVDHIDVAEVAIPVLSDIPDVEIAAVDVTESRMYIQAVSPRLRAEVGVGDVVRGGVIISNSEVGLGSISVASFFDRLRCKNGMVALEKFRQRHVGRQIDDSETLWRDDTRQAEDRAILLKVRDMIRAAVDETRFAGNVDKMRSLTGTRVVGDPAKAVEVLAQKIDATDAERGGILRALIEGGDLSAWGLLNAVTAQAHSAASHDRNVEFQAAGGQLLELSAAEWKPILEAK